MREIKCRLSIIEKLDIILSAIGEDWITYSQIHRNLKGKISVGEISKIIWANIHKIQDKIDWQEEAYGLKEWQTRMRFKRRDIYRPNENKTKAHDLPDNS